MQFDRSIGSRYNSTGVGRGRVAQHAADELENATALGRWMANRGLAEAGAVPPAPTFEAALVLREKIRDYLKCDPEDRRRNSAAGEALNKAMELFPLRVASVPQAGLKLTPARMHESFGLSAIIAELYAGSANGTLDRLKMCASGECQRVFLTVRSRARGAGADPPFAAIANKTRTYRQRRKQEAIPAAPLKNAK